MLQQFQDKWLIAGIGLSWLSYIISNQFAFGVHPTSLLFWALPGSIAIFYKDKVKTKPKILKKISYIDIIFILLISVIIIIFLILCIKPYQADIFRKLHDAKGKESLLELIKKACDVLEVYPYDIQYLQELNSLYLTTAQEEADKEFFLTKTKEIAKRFIFVDPNSDLGYTVFAIAYYLEGSSMDRVIEDYKKTLQLNPYSIDTHCNLAQTYQREGMLKEAIEEYKFALEVDPLCEWAISELRSSEVKKF